MLSMLGFLKAVLHAQSNVHQQYQDKPKVLDLIRFSQERAFDDCEAGKMTPQELLQSYLDNEVIIVNSWNKHRLTDALGDEGDLVLSEADMQEVIPNTLESFPLRNAAVKLGYNFQPLRHYKAPSPPTLSDVPSLEASSASTEVDSTEDDETNMAFQEATYGEKRNKIADAPSQYLAFPNGNITAAELAAFIPHSFKSCGVINRVISNGATSATLSRMINYFRAMPKGEIYTNTVYKMMKASMSKLAETKPEYKKWCVSNHHKSADHDPTSISVAGFGHIRRDGTTHGSIPFKDLAKGVRHLPKGADALDLTRCVKYHLQHPNENWYYPDDFENMVNSKFGGPLTVPKESLDGRVLARWNKKGRGLPTGKTKRRTSNKRKSMPSIATPANKVVFNSGIPSTAPPAVAHGTESNKRLRVDSADKIMNDSHDGGFENPLMSGTVNAAIAENIYDVNNVGGASTASIAGRGQKRSYIEIDDSLIDPRLLSTATASSRPIKSHKGQTKGPVAKTHNKSKNYAGSHITTSQLNNGKAPVADTHTNLCYIDNSDSTSFTAPQMNKGKGKITVAQHCEEIYAAERASKLGKRKSRTDEDYNDVSYSAGPNKKRSHVAPIDPIGANNAAKSRTTIPTTSTLGKRKATGNEFPQDRLDLTANVGKNKKRKTIQPIDHIVADKIFGKIDEALETPSMSLRSSTRASRFEAGSTAVPTLSYEEEGFDDDSDESDYTLAKTSPPMRRHPKPLMFGMLHK